MSVVIAAVVGTTAVGAISADRAADKAADASKKGIASTENLARQARTDAINLFSRGMQSSQNGIQGALKFYQDNAQAKIQPFIQGNVAAQRAVGQGGMQANNAILGLPVDMSFAAQPQALAANYSGITSAKLPTLGAPAASQFGAMTPQAVTAQAADPLGLQATLAAPLLGAPTASAPAAKVAPKFRPNLARKS